MLWSHRDVEAPAAAVWELLVDPQRWPDWGPTVSGAELEGGRLEAGATGTVTTVLGIPLPFTITTYEPGARWAWKVAGLPATDHRVDPLGPTRCRLGFGVPWPVAPYLAVCQVAMGRLETMARDRGEAT